MPLYLKQSIPFVIKSCPQVLISGECLKQD